MARFGPLVALATAALCAAPCAARAEARPQYRLEVRVDAEAQRVDGRAQVVVPNPTAAPLAEVFLWRYAERFATRSRALNDYNFVWIYPRAFNPGHLRTGAIRVDGAPATVEVRDHRQAGPGTLLCVKLPHPIPPGGSATLELEFETRVPARFGPFGCFRGTCILGGGFYPMVAALGAGGFDLSAPPAWGDYQLSVQVPRVSDVVINGVLHPVERGGRVEVSLPAARGAALLVGPPRLRTVEETHRGVKITLYTGARQPVPSVPGQVLPYLPEDRAGRTMFGAREAVELAAELGLPLPEEIRIVEGALRIELAQALPGFVLVSDELFDIFPLARFLKFHEFELVRAIWDEELTRRIGARGGERADDLAWAPDVGASHLVDLYTVRSYRLAEFARQILSWAAFIPAIDRILYAPQVPYASAYFYTLEDPDPLRDGLTQFSSDRPRGKVVYSKLRDLVEQKGVDQILRRELEGVPLRAAAEAVYGGPLDWFFRQWLGPYPKVDYRFAEVRSQRRGARYLHSVTVEKRGNEPPREPVEVRLRDGNGNAETQTWDGQGRRHTYVFDMAAPISVLEIDPRGRLVEELPGANDDLRFDDRRPPRWKLVYNNFGGLVRVFPTLGLDLSLDFSLSRILDLKNAMRFLLYHTDATVVGLRFSYTRGFGRKVTPGRLTSAVSTSLAAARIDPSFALAVGAGKNPGTQIATGVGIGYDDWLFVWEPQRALSLGAGVSYVLTALDSGRTLSQGSASAAWVSIVRLADAQALAMTVEGAVTFGDLRIARQMLSAGGSGGLRGYAPDELLGRAYALTRLEYRHVFIHTLNINLLHTLYVRGLGGALYAEAGLTTACSSYDVATRNLAADVGYTVMVFADWFGVSQTTLNFDFAVPLVRNNEDCFGQLPSAASRTPFAFSFAFAPPW